MNYTRQLQMTALARCSGILELATLWLAPRSWSPNSASIQLLLSKLWWLIYLAVATTPTLLLISKLNANSMIYDASREGVCPFLYSLEKSVMVLGVAMWDY